MNWTLLVDGIQAVTLLVGGGYGLYLARNRSLSLTAQAKAQT
tara:strand:- start:566 stop:691 length:126 start_codon:yes stop_codon:yes gene_type:complete